MHTVTIKVVVHTFWQSPIKVQDEDQGSQLDLIRPDTQVPTHFLDSTMAGQGGKARQQES